MTFLKSKSSFFILMLFMTVAFLQSCGPRLSSEALSVLQGSKEVPECLTETTYPDGININGIAHFYKRDTEPVIIDNKIKNMILSDPLEDPLPIPYAEVAIYDANKNLVQCGKTDSSGNIIALSGGALVIPKTPQNYTIRVYARTNRLMPNTGISATVSVKEDIYTNAVHYIQSTFTSDGVNTTPIELVAYARQTDDLYIRGGAFNIYNNYIQTYEFLDDKLSAINPSELTCLSQNLNIYWKAGFNAMQYLNPSVNPATLGANSSFYLKENTELFITGGQVGDTSLSNTDHFDDFATVHEIGHFIEDKCAKLTQGGAHAMIVRIDQRRAWHEGWSNYFAAIVMNDRINNMNPVLATKLSSGALGTGDIAWSFFYNSFGFSDSVQNIGNGSGFLMDLKKPGTSPGEYQLGEYSGIPFDKINATVYPGEGHAREGAISRALFKMSVTSSTVCSSCGTEVYAPTPITFNQIWQSLDAFGGIGDSSLRFVSSNLFLEKVKTLVGAPTWSANYKPVADSEALQLFSDNNIGSAGGKYVSVISATNHLNWVPFGHTLIQNSTCTNLTSIQARPDDPSLTGMNSDQRYSNHFYNIDPLILSGLDSITITFTRVNGTNTDHDIIIYEDGYTFNDDYTCSGGTDAEGSCPTNIFTPSRTVNEYVLASNRTVAATLSTSYAKSITDLASKLVPGRNYILNIRAYTASKSISTATEYQYSINSNLGTLCPL